MNEESVVAIDRQEMEKETTKTNKRIESLETKVNDQTTRIDHMGGDLKQLMAGMTKLLSHNGIDTSNANQENSGANASTILQNKLNQKNSMDFAGGKS